MGVAVRAKSGKLSLGPRTLLLIGHNPTLESWGRLNCSLSFRRKLGRLEEEEISAAEGSEASIGINQGDLCQAHELCRSFS